mmetsp:Transcript_52065/g.149281  ORF Transcript_52065/g.149281 Transcript_52065/m.149281 type:complete len:215 (+) Transcript_52065:196-840(+)
MLTSGFSSLSCLVLSCNFNFSNFSDARATAVAVAVAFAFACTCDTCDGPVDSEAGPLDDALAAACHASSCDLKAALRLLGGPLDRLLLLLTLFLRSNSGGFCGDVTPRRGRDFDEAAVRIAGGRRGDSILVVARLLGGDLVLTARFSPSVLLCNGCAWALALMAALPTSWAVTLRLRFALLCSLLLLLVSLDSPDVARLRRWRRSRVLRRGRAC